MGWFQPLQAASDVSKITPTDGVTLQYNILTLRWELVDKGVFPAAGAIYLGDPAIEGTWRLIRNDINFNAERLESGNWVMKGQFQP